MHKYFAVEHITEIQPYGLWSLRLGIVKLLNNIFNSRRIQFNSEKCTGQYFKVRDDDLSSKQGSLCTFKIILEKIFLSIYLHMYIYICYKIKTLYDYFFCEFDRWCDRFCDNFWIDRYFRILRGNRSLRLRYTFLKYPVCKLISYLYRTNVYATLIAVMKWSENVLFLIYTVSTIYFVTTKISENYFLLIR